MEFRHGRSPASARILVVEDEVLVAMHIEASLAQLGYVVVGLASSAAEALSLAESHRPDLVLMDITIAGELDGIEAAKALRRKRDVPIVYLTAHADDATLQRAMETSPYGYILKPFDERDLRSSIEMALYKHRMEAELRASEARFSSLVENTSDVIAVVDRTTCIQFITPSIQHTLGIDPESCVGRTFLSLVHPDDVVSVQSAIRDVESRSGKSVALEYRMIHAQGGFRTLDSVCKNLLEHPLGGIVVHARDVTERRLLESQLARADRLASVGMLAAGVGHEINNPLTYVVTNLDLLVEELPRCVASESSGQGRGAELLERAREALIGARRIATIVHELKTFSQVENESAALTPLHQVLEAAVSMIRSDARRRARIVREYNETPPVWVSIGRVAQAIVNVITNALQAFPSEDPTRNRVALSTRCDSQHAYVEVTDNACGISPEQVTKIFDPFFTTKPLGGGTGLGLAVAHNILTSYGAKIDVHSVLGEGTSFTISFPLSAEKQIFTRPVSLRPPQAPTVTARRKLLLVDDEELVGKAFRRVLSHCDVTLAKTVHQGKTILDSDCSFDVIFCDLMMPDGTGMDLHQWVRQHHPEVLERVVFLTGGAFTAKARTFLETTSNLYVEKPFDRAQLEAAIARVLGGRPTQAGHVPDTPDR